MASNSAPEQHDPSFASLRLVPPLLRAIAGAGYQVPTPIQARAIPALLDGRDVLGCAQTGTGKTAAFALPILQLIDERAGDDPVIRALVLSPTRELAAQIGESFATYGRHLDLEHMVIFGGVPENPQIARLREGVDILVATPGRLLDLMQRGVVDLRRVEVFVLDEADRMLDMGFLPDVRRIVKMLPTKRQTVLCSATMPAPIRQLADGLLHNPLSIAVARVSEAAPLIKHSVCFVTKSDKRRALVDLVSRPEFTRTIVFSRTKHGANRVAEVLERAGVSAAAIHGNKSQNARTKALDGFKRGQVRVLVATDLAARGIDVDDVTHVINFDLPNVPETYVHRIGRTGRAGATGEAVSFCDEEEREFLRDIEKLLGHAVPRVEAPPSTGRVIEPLASDRRPPPPRRGASPNGARNGGGGGRGGAGGGGGGGRSRSGGGGGGGRGGTGGGRGRGRA